MRAYPKLLILTFLVVIVALPVLAADAKPTISLSFYKDNGYGWSNDMGGLWTLKTATSTDTAYVEFYLDDKLQLNDTTAPYSWQFNTEDYPLGEHTLSAVAYDASGESETATVTRNFVEYNTSNVLLVIVVVVAVVMVIAVGVAVYRIKKSKK